MDRHRRHRLSDSQGSTPLMDILPPTYKSRSEAAPVLNRALKNFRTAKWTTLQVMADLRTLQDRGAHILYGEPNFAIWVSETFDGLQASNVRQLTRAGGVALELQSRRLIDISKIDGAPVGTTGLRELSVIANTFGEDKMAEVFVTAIGIAGDRDVSDKTVKAAMRLLMPPAATDLEIPEALDIDPDGETEDDLSEEDENDEMPKSMRERIDLIRDLTWDLPDTADALEQAVAAFQRELKGQPLEGDEKWLESGR